MSLFSDVFGGGNSGTTTQSVPDWLRPYMEKASSAATSAYDSGNLSQVADQSNLQTQAFGGAADTVASTGAAGVGTLQDQQARLIQQAQSGGYDTGALKDKAILEAGQKTADLNQNFGQAGTLGSARQAVQQGAQNAATAAQFATIDQNAAQQNFANKMAAEQALGSSVGNEGSMATGTANSLASLGAQERAVDQSQLDSTWQGVQRMSSAVYGNPAKQSAVGGK